MYLRNKLDECYALFKKGDDYKWLQDKKYLLSVGLLAHYIMSEFEHQKHTNTSSTLPETDNMNEAVSKYRQFFTLGPLTFTFPWDVSEQQAGPSPHYHMLEGASIYLVDWKLAFPSVLLHC